MLLPIKKNSQDWDFLGRCSRHVPPGGDSSLSAGLETPRFPPEELEEAPGEVKVCCAWTAAPETQPRIRGRGWINDCFYFALTKMTKRVWSYSQIVTWAKLVFKPQNLSDVYGLLQCFNCSLCVCWTAPSVGNVRLCLVLLKLILERALKFSFQNQNQSSVKELWEEQLCHCFRRLLHLFTWY